MVASSPSTQVSDAEGADGRMVAMGIALTLAAVFCFSMVDTLSKWILATYALGQLLFIRSTVGLAIMAPFVWRSGAASFFKVPQPGLHLLRTVLIVAETALFFTAVRVLPLADVTVLYMAAPVFVAAMAAMFLGERVGWRRWTAILAGFAGVVLALAPSASVATMPAAVAVMGSLVFAILMIITRHLRATPDIVLLGHQTVATLVFGLALAVVTWVPLGWGDAMLIVASAVFSLGAHYFNNRSLKFAPASTVAPYHYTLVIWATVMGFTVFGDVPAPATVVGGALIVGSGLYVYFRERKLRPGRLPELAAEPPEH